MATTPVNDSRAQIQRLLKIKANKSEMQAKALLETSKYFPFFVHSIH